MSLQFGETDNDYGIATGARLQYDVREAHPLCRPDGKPWKLLVGSSCQNMITIGWLHDGTG